MKNPFVTQFSCFQRHLALMLFVLQSLQQLASGYNRPLKAEPIIEKVYS